MVTREVKITSESGSFGNTRFPRVEDPGHRKIELTDGMKRGFEPTEWDPYVRDTKTALGNIETTVQSPTERPMNRDTFFLCINRNSGNVLDFIIWPFLSTLSLLLVHFGLATSLSCFKSMDRDLDRCEETQCQPSSSVDPVQRP